MLFKKKSDLELIIGALRKAGLEWGEDKGFNPYIGVFKNAVGDRILAKKLKLASRNSPKKHSD